VIAAMILRRNPRMMEGIMLLPRLGVDMVTVMVDLPGCCLTKV